MWSTLSLPYASYFVEVLLRLDLYMLYVNFEQYNMRFNEASNIESFHMILWTT